MKERYIVVFIRLIESWLLDNGHSLCRRKEENQINDKEFEAALHLISYGAYISLYSTCDSLSLTD